MTVLRSNAACRRSTAILSLPSVTSPRSVNGRASLCAASLRPSSQAANAFGSPASISAGPVKRTPSPPTARCPLNFTCVKPGARNSKRSRFQPVGVGADIAAHIDDAIAAERDLVDADADLDRNGGPEGAAGQFRDLADGRGRRRPRAVVAWRARGRDRSAGPTARRRSAGVLPNLKSATPVSLSPCSSEPY